jgi:hypothetical protein
MGRLISVNVGRPRDVEWNGTTIHTAIWKAPVQGRVLAQRQNLKVMPGPDLRGHGATSRAGLRPSSYRYRHELLVGLPMRSTVRRELHRRRPRDSVVVSATATDRLGGIRVSPRTTCFCGLRLEQKHLPALWSAGRPGFYMRVIEEGTWGG